MRLGNKDSRTSWSEAGIEPDTIKTVITAIAEKWGIEGDAAPDNATEGGMGGALSGRSDVHMPGQKERDAAAMAGDASLSPAESDQFYKDFPGARRFK